MTEQDHTAFSNFAYDQQSAAENFCSALSDETARQLNGMVRREIAACPSGSVTPAYDALAAILVDHVHALDNPAPRSPALSPRSDNLPF